jgi:hypothetical protein
LRRNVDSAKCSGFRSSRLVLVSTDRIDTDYDAFLARRREAFEASESGLV